MGYTNSPLVAYTKLSPNHSGQRTHSIDRITPHCVVGQLSAESICGCFTSTDRQASCNYGIGTDGRVSLCVEEKNRSWCSSSRENDQRAITIECASDKSEPYAMNDKVYATLINLCVDICQRNGKKKLLWLADKNKTLGYTPAADEMVLSVHRWFANKSCPGNWLYARLGDLATQVTAKLGGTVSTPSVEVSTSSNEKTIWDFFKGKGLNDFAIAGVMGNLYAESALKPTNLQNSYEKKLGYTNATYTAAVDDGSYGNFVKDSAGYGLAQWTFWSRKQALLEYARSVGKSIGDLGMQLDFMWNEMQGYKAMMETLKVATSILVASNAVLTQYEKPADQGESVQRKRAGYGQTYYDKYVQSAATPAPTGTLYRVQVGAYSKWENADRQLAAVQAKGFDAFITQVDGLYKVQVGAYSVKANADAQLSRVKAAGFSDAFISTAGGGTVVATAPTLKSVEEVVKEVIQGKWGNGADRKKALTEAGYDYATVQAKVNALLS